MKFLMLVCVDKDFAAADGDESEGMDIEEWVQTYDGNGVRESGDRIRPEADATVVRVRGGETMVTDGPFLETKEALAGFDILDCRDLAHAIEVAAAHPMARDGVIELRAFWVD